MNDSELYGSAFFILLTQDDCPQCERLKKMLTAPLKGQFDAHIKTIHRQQHPTEFKQLTETHAVRSVPAIIAQNGEVLRQTQNLSDVRSFLTDNLVYK